MRLMIDAPGALTTVQDLGRTGVAHLGFCTCGAMDLTSMQIANRLVGNCRGCAVLEMTLTGISARFVGEGYFALAGGDFAPTLNGKPIENYRAYGVRSGDRLQLGAARTGLRCYLAVRRHGCAGGVGQPLHGSENSNGRTGRSRPASRRCADHRRFLFAYRRSDALAYSAGDLCAAVYFAVY